MVFFVAAASHTPWFPVRRARAFLSDKRGLLAGRPVCAPRHFLPEIPIKTASKFIVAAVLFLVLLSIVTPWLVNQDSSITLLAVPFVWLAYAAAFVKFLPSHIKENK